MLFFCGKSEELRTSEGSAPDGSLVRGMPAPGATVVVFFCHATQFETAYSLLKSSGHLTGKTCVGVHWDLTTGPRHVPLGDLAKRFPRVDFTWVPSAVVESSAHPACAPIARGQIQHLSKRFGPVESWVFGFESHWEHYLAKAVQSETTGRVFLIPEGLSVFTHRVVNPQRSLTGKSALGLLLSGFLVEYLNRTKTFAHYLHWVKVMGSLLLRLTKFESPREEIYWDLILHQFKGLENRMPQARIVKFVPPRTFHARSHSRKVLFLHDPKLTKYIDLDRLAEFMKAEFPQGAEVKSHPNPSNLNELVQSMTERGYCQVKRLDDNRRAEELIGTGSFQVVVGWASTALIYCALNFPSIRAVSIIGLGKNLPDEFHWLEFVRASGGQIESPGLE